METTPFYIILSTVILLLTASVILPIYGRWQDTADSARTKNAALQIINAAEAVHDLGSVGSVQQLSIEIPSGYEIVFLKNSVIAKKQNETIREYKTDVELRYRGRGQLVGPGKYSLTVVHWIKEDESNSGKEYLLEVI